MTQAPHSRTERACARRELALRSEIRRLRTDLDATCWELQREIDSLRAEVRRGEVHTRSSRASPDHTWPGGRPTMSPGVASAIRTQAVTLGVTLFLSWMVVLLVLALLR